ncbi:hypothetical protein, partial [Dokdonella sp.]|uniref:hypothetical protein n=1 Tax=Dokdonella sp. TaxID=2291710 RepID=UPI0025BFFD9F
MNFKMTGLLALFLGMTAASYSVTVRSSKTTPQFQRTASQRPVRPFGTPRLTDLYSVTWEEIPMPDSTPLDPHVITADSITNDGTIAGRGTGALVLWHPDTQAWEEVPKHHNALPMLISPDGASVVTTDASQSPEPTKILAWNRASGWQALTGRTVTQSQAYNVSRNFRFVVGAGNNIGETAQAWVWALDGGIQQMLPNPEWSGGAGALAVSDDGNVAVGVAIRAPLPGEIWPNRLAVRWVNGGPPAMLRAPDGSELSAAVACNADCSMVFGSNGWFLKNN